MPFVTRRSDQSPLPFVVTISSLPAHLVLSVPSVGAAGAALTDSQEDLAEVVARFDFVNLRETCSCTSFKSIEWLLLFLILGSTSGKVTLRLSVQNEKWRSGVWERRSSATAPLSKLNVTTVGAYAPFKHELPQKYSSHRSPVSKCGLTYNSGGLVSVQF
jgi:hypothetical protein